MATDKAKIIKGLSGIIEEITGISADEITEDKSFVDDLDIDSLSMVEIAVETEDKYGLKIPDEQLAKLKTVKDVVDFIQDFEAKNPDEAQRLREVLDAE